MDDSTKVYRPLIRITGVPDDFDKLQAQVDASGVTHVRDTRGQVFKIFSKLNRRSVSLNTASAGPERRPYNRVESLGVLDEIPDPSTGDT